MDDIFQRRTRAKADVNEIIQRKAAHVKTIDELEYQLANIRSANTEEARAEAASAFFRGETTASGSKASLEAELRRLHELTPIFSIELHTRQKALNAIAAEYQAAVWAPLAKRDQQIKKRMAEHFVALAKCVVDELALEDEVQRADTTPPASYRPMRPNSIGTLADSNSHVSLWLRELAQFYPDIKLNF